MLKRISCHGELHLFGGEGTVIHADFRDIADELLSRWRGAARVVYLDPPFNTGSSFDFRRGKKQVAYSDALPKEEYLALIRDAAKLSYELLSGDGTFFLHIDPRISHLCRLELDGVFGEEAFVNEIVWSYKSGGRAVNSFSKKHDVIYMYRCSPEAYFNIAAVGTRRGADRRNHMKRGVDEEGRVFYSIRTNGKEYRYFEDDSVYPSDVWDDIEHLHQRDPERTGFLTQKPEALLKRMILACSEPGDLVIDLFGGSGTTAAAAAELKRSFVSVDKGACASAVTRRRLIERCLKLSLFDSVSPMSYEAYPCGAPCAEPEKYFDITEKNGALCFTIRKLPENALPYYAAVGTVSSEVFTANDYLLRLRHGESITVKPGECLHLVDEDFGEGYFLYEPEGSAG